MATTPSLSLDFKNIEPIESLFIHSFKSRLFCPSPHSLRFKLKFPTVHSTITSIPYAMEVKTLQGGVLLVELIPTNTINRDLDWGQIPPNTTIKDLERMLIKPTNAIWRLVAYAYEKKAHEVYNEIVNAIIPDSVTEIRCNTFRWCDERHYTQCIGIDP